MNKIRILLPFLLVFLSLPLCAADEEVAAEGDEVAAPSAPIYIPLQPQFVVNYGGPKGKLRYLKTGVTVRVSSSDAASSIRHHMPYVRNILVMLFAAQTDESLESQDGREAMRVSALSELRVLLEREDGVVPSTVVDVLFNTLTWH